MDCKNSIDDDSTVIVTVESSELISFPLSESIDVLVWCDD